MYENELSKDLVITITKDNNLNEGLMDKLEVIIYYTNETKNLTNLSNSFT